MISTGSGDNGDVEPLMVRRVAGVLAYPEVELGVALGGDSSFPKSVGNCKKGGNSWFGLQALIGILA